MAKAYNPYNDVKAITEYKGNYHTAKELGGDYEQWRKAAIDHYNNLVQNGYQGLADELTASDYTKSMEILKRYQPDTTSQTVDAYYDQIVGKALESAGNKGSGTGTASPADRYFSSLAGDLLKNSQTPSLSRETRNLLDTYYNNNQLLNGAVTTDRNGNITGGLNVDYYNTGKKQMDYLNNFDVTKQPYYEGIMREFQLKGGDAAKNQLASGAASNSGNIDSYAAANANRQQLAFTSAGLEAALAAAQQNQNNWQNVYRMQGDRLAGMENADNAALGYAANLYASDHAQRQAQLDAAAQLAKAEMDAQTSRYGTDSAERQNALSQAAYLASQRMGTDADRYTAELGLQGTREQANADRYAAQLGLEGAKYQTDAGLREAEINARLQRYLEELGLEGTKYAADRGLEGTKYQTDADLAGTRAQADANRSSSYYDYLSSLYQSDTQRDIANAELAAQERAAEREAQAALAAQTGQTAADDEEAEYYQEMNGLLRELADGSNDEIKSYNDILNVMAELYPDKTSETRAYLNFYINNMTGDTKDAESYAK